MFRAALRSLLVASIAIAPGLAPAQDATPGPKLPAMPSLAKDNGDTTKPAGALPPAARPPEPKPAPKAEEKNKPEPAKKGGGKNAEARAKTPGRAAGGRAAKHSASGHNGSRRPAAKPHAAAYGRKRR